MILLDASFIVAYYNEKDVHHNKAVEIMAIIINSYKNLIIYDYIFDEVINVLLRKIDLHSTIEIGNVLINSVEILNIGDNLFDESWEIFKNQKNTKLSFTDCSILAVMKKDHIKYIATFDKDFSNFEGIEVVDIK